MLLMLLPPCVWPSVFSMYKVTNYMRSVHVEDGSNGGAAQGAGLPHADQGGARSAHTLMHTGAVQEADLPGLGKANYAQVLVIQGSSAALF